MKIGVSIASVLAAWLWSAAAADAQTPAPAPVDPHAGHHVPAPDQGAAEAAGPPPRAPLPDFIPPVTEADRAAAFPDVRGHSVHDAATHAFVLFDQLEWLGDAGASAAHWDTKGWVGGDRTRLWFRTEGERQSGDATQAEAQVFYGRPISPWWDVIAGVRQDLDRPARTWAAIGVQGLAPYWFEVEGTFYVSASGHTELRLETAYELLVTNRLVLQPLVELRAYGRADRRRDLGRGLGSTDVGLRIRYEFRREIAPYVGLTWTRVYFGTAERLRAGEEKSTARLAVGVRAWF